MSAAQLTVTGFDGHAVIVESDTGRRYPIPLVYADAALIQMAIDAMRHQQAQRAIHIADQVAAQVDTEYQHLLHGRT